MCMSTFPNSVARPQKLLSLRSRSFCREMQARSASEWIPCQNERAAQIHSLALRAYIARPTSIIASERHEREAFFQQLPCLRCGLVFVVLAIIWHSAAVAQDVVHLKPNSTTGVQRSIAGKVVDATGLEITIHAEGRRDQTFKRDRVDRIEYVKVKAHQQGDELLAKHRTKEALAKYEQAMRDEKRNWVRRDILAAIVDVHRMRSSYVRSGKMMLLLIRNDPTTHHLGSMPLSWRPYQPAPELTSAAKQWLESSTPHAVLMGASWLLSGKERPRAIKRLEQITTLGNNRVSSIAQVQLWRTQLVSIDAVKLARWQRTVAQMPETLRVGPYFLIGRAHAQLEQHDLAALAMLRVPLLYADQRSLAAEAMLTAGAELQLLGQHPEAAKLYRELIRDYADRPQVTQARQRLSSAAGP